MNFRIMTFNIQHGLNFIKLLNKERVIDLDSVVNTIKENNVDVVGLNEVYNDINNVVTVEQAKYISEKLGYNYYYFGQSITIKETIGYGNAILSKYPLSNFVVHKIEDPIIKDEDVFYESRSIIECNALLNDENIKIFVTHLGLAKSEQQNGVNKLMELIKDEKTILLGDFNMEEDNDNIKLLSTKIKNNSYLIEGNNKTYPSNKPNIKIDYIFTKNILVKKCEIIKKIVSDHYPVIIDIEI